MFQKTKSWFRKLALTVPEPKNIAENTLAAAGAMAAVAALIFSMDTLYAFLMSVV